MTTYTHKGGLDRTKDVLNSLSYDSRVINDAAQVADALKLLYGDNLTELRLSIEEMLEDDAWSQDRQPYEWLREIAEHLS